MDKNIKLNKLIRSMINEELYQVKNYEDSVKQNRERFPNLPQMTNKKEIDKQKHAFDVFENLKFQIFQMADILKNNNIPYNIERNRSFLEKNYVQKAEAVTKYLEKFLEEIRSSLNV